MKFGSKQQRADLQPVVPQQWRLMDIQYSHADYDYVHRGFPKTLASGTASISLLPVSARREAADLGPRKEGFESSSSQPLPLSRSTSGKDDVRSKQDPEPWLILHKYKLLSPMCKLVSQRLDSKIETLSIYEVSSLQDLDITLIRQVKKNSAANKEDGDRWVEGLSFPALKKVMHRQNEIANGEQVLEETLYKLEGKPLGEYANHLSPGDSLRIALQLIDLLVWSVGQMICLYDLMWNSQTKMLSLHLQGWTPIPIMTEPSTRRPSLQLPIFGLLLYTLLGWEREHGLPLPLTESPTPNLSSSARGNANQRLATMLKATIDSDSKTLENTIESTLKARKQSVWWPVISACLHCKETTRQNLLQVQSLFTRILAKVEKATRRCYHYPIAVLLKTPSTNPAGMVDCCKAYIARLKGECSQPLAKRQQDCAMAYDIQGCAFNFLKRYDEALECHYLGGNTHCQLMGPSHPLTATSWLYMAAAYSQLREPEEVLRCCARVEGVFQGLSIMNAELKATLCLQTALAYGQLGEEKKAIMYAANVEVAQTRDLNEYMKPRFAAGSVEKYQKMAEYKNRAQLFTEGDLEDPISLLFAYQNSARDYMNGGQYKSALEYFLLAEAILKANYGEDNPLLCENYNAIGCVYDKMHDYTNSLEYYLKTEKIALLHEQDEPEMLDLALYNLRVTYSKLGDSVKAAEYAAKVEDQYTSYETPTVSTGLHHRVSTQTVQAFELFSSGDYPEALTGLKAASAMAETGDMECAACLAPIMLLLGLIYNNQMDFEAVKVILYRAENYYKALVGNHDIELQSIYLISGQSCLNLQQYNQAIEYLHKGLTLAQKLGGPRNPQTLLAHRWLGQAYTAIGDFKQAQLHKANAGASTSAAKNALSCTINLNQTGHAMRKKAPRPASEPALVSSQSAASALPSPASKMPVGSIESKKIAQYKAQIENYCRQHGDNNITVALMWNTLGILYTDMEKYESAEECYKKALAICTNLKDAISAATAMRNLISVYDQCEQFDKAIEYHIMLLALLKESPRENYQKILSQTVSLAEAYNSKGDYESAIKYYQEAAVQYTQLGYSFSLDAIDCYIALEKLYAILEREDQSFECLQKIIALYRSIKQEDEYMVLPCLRLMNRYLSLGQYQQALEVCHQVERIARKFPNSSCYLKSDIYPAFAKAYKEIGNLSKAQEYEAKFKGPQ